MAIIKTVKDFKSLPWKNGGGTTTEIYRVEHSAGSEKFLLRFSSAVVEKDGPFSFYENIDRTLVLLEGYGFKLKFDHHEIVVDEPLSPVEFTGESKIECELIDERCIDFNVMIDRNWGKAEVTCYALNASEPFTSADSRVTYIYEHRVDPVLWCFEANEEVEITPTSDCVFIVIRISN